MLPFSIQTKLNKVKESCLILDIETSSHFPDGRPIDIKKNFEEYVAFARIKWFGGYSYKYNKSYYLNAITQSREIIQLLKEHSIIVGFNSEEFDFPILNNNGLSEHGKWYTHVDLMQILGTSNQKNKSGYAFKNRGELMEYEFKNNSLRCMAEAMGLETQKGNIDYSIFYKEDWTEEETTEIITYLSSDVQAEKQMFDILWNYWLPFAELLDEKYVYDLSWIRNSIASLTYKCACRVLEIEPTYSENKSVSEDMGGNVYLPKYEEATKIWYLDFSSLYPHMFTMFNLPAEIHPDNIDKYEKVWHGNNLFKVKGYYDISSWHRLSRYISEKLKERIDLITSDESNPLIYTLKIFLNGLYGIFRSSLFEKIHTPNCGWDCCWLGQQVQAFTVEMLEQFGFEHIYGDTDSAFIIAKDEKYNNREYVQDCLNQIIEIVKDNVPFPVDTFKIKIEHYLDYITFPFSEEPIISKDIRDLLKNSKVEGYEEKLIDKKKHLIEIATNKIVKIGRSWIKERTGKKKNYIYIYEKNNETKIEIVGLPIKKSNATNLSMQIFKEVLEPKIIENNRAKFSKDYIQSILNDYLKKPEVMESLAVEYKVNKAESYKTENQIQAQISKAYFNGDTGVIRLLKNSKIGKVGKSEYYCTVQEAIEANLTIKEINLEKVMNELEPFIIYEEKVDKT